MDRDRSDRGNGPERKDREEEAGNYDFRKGAQDLHDAANNATDPGVGHQVARGEEAKHEAECGADDSGEDRDVHGLQHLVHIFGNVEALGQVEPAFGIVVLEAAVVIGRGQVEHGAEDFQPVTRREVADEV